MNGEGYVAALRQLCGDYVDEMERRSRERGPLQGFLGFGMTMGQEPCNKTFADRSEALLKDMAADPEPASADVRQVLEYLYAAAQEHTDFQAVYWMLRAAQGFSKPLIPRLAPEDARAVRTAYEKLYRRYDRLPVQNELLALLKKAEKGK